MVLSEDFFYNTFSNPLFPSHFPDSFLLGGCEGVELREDLQESSIERGFGGKTRALAHPHPTGFPAYPKASVMVSKVGDLGARLLAQNFFIVCGAQGPPWISSFPRLTWPEQRLRWGLRIWFII